MSEHTPAKTVAPKSATTEATANVAVSRPALTPARTSLLQRACACGELPGSGGKCDECDKKNKKTILQRASNGGPQPAAVPPVVNQVLSSPGRPLDTSTRAHMESRFGQDFGGVRIHNDASAAESARAVNARAYTVGQHIAFDQGQYAPHTESGKHLLAHELAHTIQQQGLQRFSSGPTLDYSPEYARLEQEAGATADAVMRGGSVSLPRLTSGPLVQRAPWSDGLDGKQCPAGTNIDPRKSALIDPQTGQPPKDIKDITVATVAEEKIVDYYLQQNAGNLIATGGITKGGGGRKLLETLYGTDPMLLELKKEFHSGKNPFLGKTQTVANPEVAVPPNQEGEEGESPFEQVQGAYAAREEGALMYKRPDIMNITKRRVFDVTTVGQTPAKVSKIADIYVGTLEDIRKRAGIGEPAWQAGSEADFPAPPKQFLLYRYQGTNVICYGPTDLAKYPGVISYVALDLGAAAAQATGEPYELSIMGQTVTISTFPAPSDTDLLNSGPENKAVAESIPGVILKTLHRKKQGSDTIDAEIETADNSKSGHKSTMPLKLTGTKVQAVYLVNKQTRKLTLQPAKTSIPVEYPKLSKGTITKLNYDETAGLSGVGTITPSVSFLSSLTLGFAFAQDSLSITKGVEEAELKKRSILGMRVTRADLVLQLAPEFKPSGILELQAGPADNPIARAAIKVEADDIGLVATCTINVNIPKMKTAETTITYKGGGGRDEWTGNIEIKSEDINLGPSVSVNGSFTGQFDKTGLNFAGKVSATFPGNNTAELELRKKDQDWVLSGTGKFYFPKLDETTVKVTYYLGKGVLVATGKTGFTIPSINLSGRLDEITFTITEGAPLQVSGRGGLDFRRGKAEGHIDVVLHPSGKFSGTGSVTYKLKENIIVTGIVELNKEEKLRVIGKVLVTRYEIFKQYADERNLFKLDIPVPVPGLSIGTSGVVFHIGGGVKVSYSFGPGVIEPLEFSAGFDPLESDPNLELTVTGSVKIPAAVTLSAWITGSLALQVDVGIASAGAEGGLTLQGDLMLRAGAFANFKAAYKDRKLTANLDAGIEAKLLLGLSLTAFVRAWAGAFGITGEVRKDWKLAHKEIDTRLGFYLKAPFSYADDTGVKLPEMKDIELRTPEVTIENMERILGEIFGQTTPTVKES